MAIRRPVIAFREGEPRAGPVELQNEFASLMSDLSVRAREVQST